jgi:hypothetical protein
MKLRLGEAGASPPRTADAVVQQATARAEQREQPVDVHPELRQPDVLEHPDRGDRVERAVVDLPVVLESDRHPIG